jgi:hypothetical protein
MLTLHIMSVLDTEAGTLPILAAPRAGLMVEQNFKVHAERRAEGPSTPFTPAADWNGKFPNEWVFEFRRWLLYLTPLHAVRVCCPVSRNPRKAL